jgi:hypothetical protein
VGETIAFGLLTGEGRPFGIDLFIRRQWWSLGSLTPVGQTTGNRWRFGARKWWRGTQGLDSPERSVAATHPVSAR